MDKSGDTQVVSTFIRNKLHNGAIDQDDPAILVTLVMGIHATPTYLITQSWSIIVYFVTK
jgi:hypothetical protein